MSNLKSAIIEILGLESNCSDEELIRAVSRLKEDDEMLNLAIDNSVDSFNIADGNGVFIRVNETFAHSSRINRTDAEGKSTKELIEMGCYGPDSAVELAIREKKRVALMQGGRGNDAIAISTPILDEEGNIRYVVSNARFTDELKLLKMYVDGLNSNDDSDEVEIKLEDHRKMIWKSERMREILGLVSIIAPTDSSIMITGETGTGKSMLARYIHEISTRKKGKFVEINCAAIPENLIESELFGYESGAFTGADAKGKKGLLSAADGGTLFLDEIGDMPLNLQAKLLQTLQNKTFTRVGGEEVIKVDVRLITATNKKLEKMVEEGLFREELYYRINVVPIYLPSLRERMEDTAVIIDTAVDKFKSKYNKEVILANATREALMSYSWPGNIRELENTIERLVVINRTGVITVDDLPVKIAFSGDGEGNSIRIKDVIPLNDAVEEVEKQLITIAYNRHKSSYKVAEALGISQSAASRRIIKYIRDNNNEKD